MAHYSQVYVPEVNWQTILQQRGVQMSLASRRVQSQDRSTQVVQQKEHPRTPPGLNEVIIPLTRLQAEMHKFRAEMHEFRIETRNNFKQIEAKLDIISTKAENIENGKRNILNHLQESRTNMPRMVQKLLSDIQRTFMAALAPTQDVERSEANLDRDWLLNQFEEISKIIVASCNATQRPSLRKFRSMGVGENLSTQRRKQPERTARRKKKTYK
ncbi:uncharacterized protein PV09_09386 [Verruconis gallopava]|uniref:Uncharacterized protein n=1 Tax=Verruconis gallopava TaxID=253628 RepID=A0A0D1X9K8_9PEZI|nr:uncharacterized protein PV09_09386 [Verruconis gallopava]KIV98860.1 hypothetical protein PV09_09386 [Verruconis gallopava]